MRSIQVVLCLAVCCLFFARPSASQAVAELIFQPGSTSFPSSHASTVVELNGGKVMAAWFGGTAEGKSDVAIWSATRDDQGWTEPKELVREPGIACYNPVLFYTHDRRLWLYYKFGPSPATWSAGRIFSTDNGRTWSQPQHLPAGLLGPIRANPWFFQMAPSSVAARSKAIAHGPSGSSAAPITVRPGQRSAPSFPLSISTGTVRATTERA